MSHQSHVPQAPLRSTTGVVVAVALLCSALAVVLATRVLPDRLGGSHQKGSLSSSSLPFRMLCQGFNDCANQGYDDDGYGLKAHYNTMYWNMYSGSNCVNYVAYRMIQGGMSATRPAQLKPGKGNAEYWGTSFPGLTDNTPSIGAVAWWKGGATGAGSMGHVAYVEKVVSGDDIIVSESNWGSPFDWREITGPTDWPTGFIHLADRSVSPVVPPSLIGTPTVGQKMTVKVGSWSPHASFSYKWTDEDGDVVGTKRTLTPTAKLYGKGLTLTLTASAKNYQATSVHLSSPAPVAPGTLSTTTAPTVTGTPQASLPLTVGQGAYTPKAGQESVQWYADGQPIDGATDWTFTPTVDQIGAQITAQVTAGRAGYTAVTTTTDPTRAVLGLPIAVQGGAVTGTPVRTGTVTVSPGDVTPSALTPTYQWRRDGVAIEGATAATYHPILADVGHKLSVLVTVAGTDYQTYRKTYALGRVGTQGHLVMYAHGKSGLVSGTLKLTAPGFTDGRLTRWVDVKLGDLTQKVHLVDGAGSFRLTGIEPGKHLIRVSWAGSKLISAAYATAKVRVYSPAGWAKAQNPPAKKAPKKPATPKKSQPSASSTPSSKPSSKPSSSASAKPSSSASAKSSKSASAKPSKSPSAKATSSSSASAKPKTKKTS